jgi:hypothetical protein
VRLDRASRLLALLRRLALLEERRELGDLTDRLRRQPTTRQAIVALDEIALDGALELAEGGEDERASIPRRDVPEILAEVAVATTDLELVPAVGALHRRSTTAHERVVELVLGVAPLALDVHREGRSGRAENPTDQRGLLAVADMPPPEG